jgi:hypothetical protein
MKYFLHDSSSFQDEKITLLFIKYGYEGLGLFYTILEKLALQEKPISEKILKKQLFISKKLEKIWSFLHEIELISTKNGETFNERLINFAGKYKIKNEKNSKRISEWRERQDDTKNVTRYNGVTDSVTDSVTERVRNACKLNKESKVNKYNKGFSEIKKDILNSQQWKETFLMNYKCNEDYLNSKLNEFFIMLENTGDTDKTEKEIKYYFTHWLKKKYPLQSKTIQPTFDPARQYIDENGKIQVKVSR